jgi:hypothetical protein
MADPEPPQPIPFPIKIVNDSPPPPDDLIINDGVPPPPNSKKTDYFYASWDKFLALEPKRSKSLSTPARKVAEEQEEVEKSEGAEGLQIEENAATSWEQAAEECKAKVAAIVEECKRLNQKYRDAIFDLESNGGCLQALHGRYPKVRPDDYFGLYSYLLF